MHDLGRIHGLGIVTPMPFPVVETVGALAGTGLLVGGLVVQKTPGTVMAILGGVTLLGSGVSLLLKMTGVAGGPPGVPMAPPPAPPPPPAAPKPPAYAQYMNYAQAALPVVNQLFSKLFGVNRQPHMLVAVGRGR